MMSMKPIKLSTAMRDAFIEADPSLQKKSSGIIYRKQMWNRGQDTSPVLAINRAYFNPRKKFIKKKLNRGQMYEYSRNAGY